MNDKDWGTQNWEEALGKLETERDHYKKQWMALQEMLAQVLNAVGEPVIVDVDTKLEPGTGIVVDFNDNDREFVFYLSKEDDEPVHDGS